MEGAAQQEQRISQLLLTMSSIKQIHNQCLDYNIQQLAISNSALDIEIDSIRKKSNHPNLPKICIPIVGAY
jgi:hypothetical protein